METKIEVSKITININGKLVELTPADARKLRDELSALLGGDRVQYLPYSVPVNDFAPRYPKWGHPDVTCHTLGNSMDLSGLISVGRERQGIG